MKDNTCKHGDDKTTCDLCNPANPDYALEASFIPRQSPREVKIYLHTLPLGGFIRAVDEAEYLALQRENAKLKDLLHTFESSEISGLVMKNHELEEVHKFHVIELKDLQRELAEQTGWKEAFRDQVEGETKINERWQGYNCELQKSLATANARIELLEAALKEIRTAATKGDETITELECHHLADEALKPTDSRRES